MYRRRVDPSVLDFSLSRSTPGAYGLVTVIFLCTTMYSLKISRSRDSSKEYTTPFQERVKVLKS